MIESATSNRPMTVVVTGGAGFIGSHVCARLVAAGCNVVAIDNLSGGTEHALAKDVELIACDLLNQDRLVQHLREINPDAICHHAAQPSVPHSLANPVQDFKENVVASVQLLEITRQIGCNRFVFASSGGAIGGECSLEAPKKEDDPPNLANPYAAAKLAFEAYLAAYSHAFGMETWALRYANVYGPRQRPHGEAAVVAAFCDRALAGETLHVFGATTEGDGGCIRDYIYVDDVARTNQMAILGGLEPGVYNVATGVATKTVELAEQIAALLPEVVRDAAPCQVKQAAPRGGDVQISLLDASRLKSAGWQVETPLRDGLRDTLVAAAEARGLSVAATD